MICKCDELNINQVFEYIGEDYEKCLYMYIDLVKYGVRNKNFEVWIQYDASDICALISKYYNGIQIYSKSYNLIADELITFIKEKNPDIIAGMGKSMYFIKDYFPEYHETKGYVGKLNKLTYPPNPNAYSASFIELKEIAKLVAQDENLGKGYNYKMIYNQFYNRRKDKFGRNFIVRDESNNELICHAATYAELQNLAVISGVITAPLYRGKGYSKGILAAICDQLLSEDKRVFSYFSILPSIKMHYGVGFEEIGDWIKLKK